MCILLRLKRTRIPSTSKCHDVERNGICIVCDIRVGVVRDAEPQSTENNQFAQLKAFLDAHDDKSLFPSFALFEGFREINIKRGRL